MKRLMISAGLVLAGLSSAGAAEQASLQGQAYRLTLESSRFDVGPNRRDETEGLYTRAVGDRGAFMVDTVTGATLAVPSFAATALPKGEVASLPQPLTKDPERHSAAVRDYLVATGVPKSEISGMHVTTTMAGSGPADEGVTKSHSTLLWYTSHLERSLGGIPVEGSYAYAALDRSGKVISEGVYWPSIPADVVARAMSLQKKLAAPAARAAFVQNVKKVSPEAETEAGEVKIVHTSSGYHGQFEAKAVYSVIARSAVGEVGRGKARILRFDAEGKALAMADEVAAGANSAKQ